MTLAVKSSNSKLPRFIVGIVAATMVNVSVTLNPRVSGKTTEIVYVPGGNIPIVTSVLEMAGRQAVDAAIVTVIVVPTIVTEATIWPRQGVVTRYTTISAVVGADGTTWAETVGVNVRIDSTMISQRTCA